jgi:hypothetical protein
MIYERTALNKLRALRFAQQAHARRILRQAARARAAASYRAQRANPRDADFPLPAAAWRPASPGKLARPSKPAGLQARVRKALGFWAKAGAPPKILRWIAKGVDLPFHS